MRALCQHEGDKSTRLQGERRGQDPRCQENEQLRARIVDERVAKQVAQERQIPEERHLGHGAQTVDEVRAALARLGIGDAA